MLISSQDSYLSQLILVHYENVLFQVTCVHYLRFLKSFITFILTSGPLMGTGPTVLVTLSSSAHLSYRLV